MKTDYKILWIDDDHETLVGDKAEITKFLGSKGIETKFVNIEVEPEQTPTNEQAFIEAVNDLDLDMVFIDFNMPQNGQDIINFIRKDLHHYFLPVLFYTGEDDAVNTLTHSIFDTASQGTGFSDIADGIFFCDRDHITEKAKKILTSLLKKEERPQQVRGLLMDRLSELDALILKSFGILWEKIPASEHEVILQTLIEELDKKAKNVTSVKDAIAKGGFNELLSILQREIFVIDSHKRAGIYKKILQSIPDLSEKSGIIARYFQQQSKDHIPLITLRNNYAHKTTLDLIGVHNDSRCVSIRNETRLYISEVSNIIDNN